MKNNVIKNLAIALLMAASGQMFAAQAVGSAAGVTTARYVANKVSALAARCWQAVPKITPMAPVDFGPEQAAFGAYVKAVQARMVVQQVAGAKFWGQDNPRLIFGVAGACAGVMATMMNYLAYMEGTRDTYRPGIKSLKAGLLWGVGTAATLCLGKELPFVAKGAFLGLATMCMLDANLKMHHEEKDRGGENFRRWLRGGRYKKPYDPINMVDNSWGFESRLRATMLNGQKSVHNQPSPKIQA